MIKYDDLVTQLKNRQFAPVYLLMGEEPFFIDRVSKFFENHVLEEANRDFNQVVLFGKDVTAADILANVKQFPFGSQYRLVIVKEAKDVKDLNLLKEYVQRPMTSTILVLCHKYGKPHVSLSKACDKPGVVFESVPKRDYEIPSWVQEQAQKFHFQLSPDTANLLVEHIGNDLSRIYTEFEKLRVVLPPNSTISADIVEKYIGISKEYNIFELQDALGSRNIQKAYKITLNFAKHQKENPNIKTIQMLYTFYHKMLQYQLLPDKSQENTRKIYGNLPPTILQRNCRYAMSHSIPQLTNIISILREYDVKAKGVDTNCSEEDLIKEMIYKIIH